MDNDFQWVGGDPCMVNPLLCTRGLSISLFYKVVTELFLLYESLIMFPPLNWAPTVLSPRFWEIFRYTRRETPLPAQNKTGYPRSQLPSTLWGGGGGGIYFYPFPSLSLIKYVCSSSACFITDEMLFTRTAFTVPGNRITDEENICYPNSALPRNLWYQSIIFPACAPFLF